jgi:hypothetical protein
MRDSFASGLGISEGQLIYVYIDAKAFFSKLWERTVVNNTEPPSTEQPIIYFENVSSLCTIFAYVIDICSFQCFIDF